MFLLVIISAQSQTNQKGIKPLFSVGICPAREGLAQPLDTPWLFYSLRVKVDL